MCVCCWVNTSTFELMLRIYSLCELLLLCDTQTHTHTHTCTHTHSPLPRNIYFSSHISRSPLLTYFLLSKQVKVDHTVCYSAIILLTNTSEHWLDHQERETHLSMLTGSPRDKHLSMLTESPLQAERYAPQYADWITREESWWGVGYTLIYYIPTFLY